MAMVIRRLPAVLAAVIVAAALALAAGVMTTQAVYAADDELGDISFKGVVTNDWPAAAYALEDKKATLTLEQLQISVLDKKGQAVPAEAYSLELYSTWYDETADQDRQMLLHEPYGMVEQNPDTAELGLNEILVKVKAVDGQGYQGELEKTVFFYDKHSLYWICSSINFEGAKYGGWRMMDYCIVPSDQLKKPIVKSADGTVLTEGVEYTIKYYTRVNDATDDRGLITEGGTELSGPPAEEGKYYAVLEGAAPYYGGNKIPFDVAPSANPKYIKALTSKSKPVAVKASKVKKSAQSVAASKLVKLQNGCVLVPKNDPVGFKPYKKAGGDKCLTVNQNTGKVTVKKGTKKGTYKIKLELHPGSIYEDAANDQKTVTCYIKVK